MRHYKNKIYFFSCVCIKWLILPKKHLKTMTIKVIVDSVNALWLNERHTEEQLGHKNLPAVTNKYGKNIQKTQMNQ